LTFYFYGDPKHTATSWDEKVAARRRHILWIVARDPGGPLLDGWRTINPAYDAAGYAQAKTLWLAETARKDVPVPVLSNAASFFSRSDRPLAERFLLQAEARDPGGPTPRVKDSVYYTPWTARLGGLYAEAIADLVRRQAQSGAAPPNATDVDSTFATAARRTLDETSDVALLTSAGQSLVRNVSYSRDLTTTLVESKLLQLGTTYLNRAVQLDPGATAARSLLVWQASWERSRELQARLKGVAQEKQQDIILALPVGERIVILPGRVDGQLMSADYQEFTKHDPAAAKSAIAIARAYAEDLLKLTDRLPNDPNRGTAIFSAHVALGTLALRDNDLASALTHMEAAGNAPSSDELRYGSRFDWSRLAVQMLKWGERESVVRFLERFASISESQRERLMTDAAQIRAGRMPSFYQTQTVPH
jgi:hypothetical protein